MGQLVQLPKRSVQNQYGARLQTQGEEWVRLEKKLLDRAEFLEAMILVLDDVRLQNIRSRDFAMMEVVSEEIPAYQKRLEDIQDSLTKLRNEYIAHQTMAN